MVYFYVSEAMYRSATLELIGYKLRHDILLFLKGEEHENADEIGDLDKIPYSFNAHIATSCIDREDFELLDALVETRPEVTGIVLKKAVCSARNTNVLEHLHKMVGLTKRPELFQMLLAEKYEGEIYDCAEVLLACGCLDQDSVSSCAKNQGPFCMAAQFGKLRLVERLLETGLDPSLENGSLAVAAFGNHSILRHFVAHGVDVNRTYRGYTYLQIAAWQRDCAKVKRIFLLGANTTTMDRYNRVALVLWFHSGYTVRIKDGENLAKTIPNALELPKQRFAPKFVDDLLASSHQPTGESFSRASLDQVARPPRELFDHTPPDYVRAFLEYDSGPAAQALVDYILSCY